PDPPPPLPRTPVGRELTTRDTRQASNFEVGERCLVWGRIQSREYMKKLSEDELEKRIAYEVSVSKLELPEDDEEAL
ncbi:MAG: single-stranded DNA-binding protein, partial [Lachnospiraceae bacterium]|nr:single-stranded DNA-binding protein [Lachnospiraceae bacterium]